MASPSLFIAGGILIGMVAPASKYAQISTADGRVTVQLTEADVLWAARAASYEAKRDSDPAKILWTFTQRWVQQRAVGKNVSFQEALFNFAQPINPSWRAGGSNCRPGGPYAADAACAPEVLERRAEAARATWEELRTRDAQNGMRVVELTQRWARALLPNPLPRVTNFAMARVAKNYLENNPRSELALADNDGHWYIIDPPATRWPPNYVLIISPEDGRVAGAAVESLWRERTTIATRAFFQALSLHWF